MNELKAGVIGGGAIGLLTASFLKRAGFQVTLYVRREEQVVALRNGLFYEKDGIESNYSVQVKLLAAGVEEQIVFLAVKQYDVPGVLEVLSPNPSQTVIFLQNGMGHIDYLTELNANIVVGVVEHGALKASDSKVVHTGQGRLRISHFNGKASQAEDELWDALNHTGYHVVFEQSWYEVLVEKLMINAVINPLTALYRVKNGELLTNPFYHQSMRQLFDEAVMVVKVSDKEQTWRNIVEVCKKTAGNQSSMLRDVSAGRKTEIDAISGYILTQATQQNLAAPVTQFIFTSIKGSEIKEERDE